MAWWWTNTAVYPVSSRSKICSRNSWGEIHDEYDTERPVISLPDGKMLIDASISLRDLKEDYQILLPESSEYETLAES